MGLLKPRTAKVPIYHGDDMAILAELHRKAEVAARLAEAAAAGPRRLGDVIPNADAEKAAYDAFVDEAAERAFEVELEAIGSRRFRDLLAAHPPRVETVDGREQIVEADQEYAVNTETLPMALLTFRDESKATITDPSLPEDELREFLEDDCSDGDLERLWETAFWLNRGDGDVDRLGKFSTGSPTSP